MKKVITMIIGIMVSIFTYLPDSKADTVFVWQTGKVVDIQLVGQAVYFSMSNPLPAACNNKTSFGAQFAIALWADSKAALSILLVAYTASKPLTVHVYDNDGPGGVCQVNVLHMK